MKGIAYSEHIDKLGAHARAICETVVHKGTNDIPSITEGHHPQLNTTCVDPNPSDLDKGIKDTFTTNNVTGGVLGRGGGLFSLTLN
ncbi:unnamed protein product [Rotaria sordida]|uniref:Uncharacterized protein n=1 Tax=Rotaria sordida TaxID=392033 RepID=A0A814LKK7_9BILA|nr:unnamed protein product [Rotaria sordida]CAF1039615.1 unnamed protein product [Rotaria sordida]CAF1065963.1 unnamed protein product [Rotaria sordida]CAF3668495.1 unnamed protein product [Rotaria sordida]CAF3730561.1 unnamed protein product [Rotaria sordida]